MDFKSVGRGAKLLVYLGCDLGRGVIAKRGIIHCENALAISRGRDSKTWDRLLISGLEAVILTPRGSLHQALSAEQKPSLRRDCVVTKFQFPASVDDGSCRSRTAPDTTS